jgi:hypothetical protein
MANLQADSIADLVTMTQKELGKLKWTDLTSDLQEYIFLPKILKKEKVQFGSGYGIQWNVMMDFNKNARHVGLYAKDIINIADSMKTATIPWRHCTVSYAIDRREIAMNREPSKIVDIVKNRRIQGMIDLANEVETAGWSAPPSSSDDVMPYGLDYWITITGATSTAGFNGTGATGFTTNVAGLNPATWPRWRNWNATYTSVTKASLIKLMREGAAKTFFIPPVEVSDYNRGDRYVWYTNYTTLAKMEDLLEQQNDNLGKDLASMDGAVRFRKAPVVYAPYLDANTKGPVIGVNWGQFYPVFLSGEYLVEATQKPAPEQHTVLFTTIDLSWNLCCKDRRRQMRFQTST